jgi:predicted ABC-type ATPase
LSPRRYPRTVHPSSDYDDLAAFTRELRPFHWEMEFPTVFFEEQGVPRQTSFRGFDAILGNPPYVSTHTSSEQTWRNVLSRRAGYLEDLYVHFTDLGFHLLRPNGIFGFIVSDTFFTLASKLRMRQLLQENRFLYLGQCDPFEATVDAAIFVAAKGQPGQDHNMVFIQARPRKGDQRAATRPEEDLPDLAMTQGFQWNDGITKIKQPKCAVSHAIHKSLRLHSVPAAFYVAAHRQVFFEPRHGTLNLFERFNEPVKRLVDQWWPKIETSHKFADNIEKIKSYHRTLKPGDITLVGLIAEGGQGMRTANNGRFLGYLEGTPQAQEILGKRESWTRRWRSDDAVGPVFEKLLKENGGDPNRPIADGAAWEACLEPLRDQFGSERLGLGKGDLYRIVPSALVADERDFAFAWARRKAELFSLWKRDPHLEPFWQQEGLLTKGKWDLKKLREAGSITDDDFCRLCTDLLSWVARENPKRKAGERIPRSSIGLRSSEKYPDPTDAPRIAAIYNGLSGRGLFVPFRKGDPEGNRWVDNEPLYVDWSKSSVEWLFENSGRPESGMPVMRNAHIYLTSGITWTAVANHVAMKARFQDPCVFDADSMRLTPVRRTIAPLAFLALFNSDILSFFKMKFLKHTQKWEIGDLRQLPIVIPSKAQEKTTFAMEFLPDFVNCREFLNADLIAAGLSPFAPETQNVRAGRLLLTRIRELIEEKDSFGFETTLSGRGYMRLFKRLRANGYQVVLFFLWLPNADMAVSRVRARVRQGGHNVPEPVVRRRYKSGLLNALSLYKPLVHVFRVYDASHLPPKIVAHEDESSLAWKADAAFQQAAYKVIQRAKQTGTPVVIWEDEQIKEVPPEEMEMRMGDKYSAEARP